MIDNVKGLHDVKTIKAKSPLSSGTGYYLMAFCRQLVLTHRNVCNHRIGYIGKPVVGTNTSKSILLQMTNTCPSNASK